MATSGVVPKLAFEMACALWGGPPQVPPPLAAARLKQRNTRGGHGAPRHEKAADLTLNRHLTIAFLQQVAIALHCVFPERLAELSTAPASNG